MNVASCIATVIAVFCCNSVFGEDDGKELFRIRPIQILSRDRVPTDVPFEMRPGAWTRYCTAA